MTRRHRRPPDRIASRSGAAALLVLVCLSFATVVATLLVEAGLAGRKYTTRLELTHQADWLVEAGLSRAAAQLARSPKYAGETWRVPAAPNEKSRPQRSWTGVVHIQIKDVGPPKSRLIRVTAELHGESGIAVEAAKEVMAAAR